MCFFMTDVAISVMLIAGFGEESHYYHWENVNLGVFIFALKLVLGGGRAGMESIKSFIPAHNSLTSFYPWKPIFCEF